MSNNELGRPLPDALDSVEVAANNLTAVAQKVNTMIDEFRAGFLWQLLTWKKES
jgi:hypothetical protein